MNKGTGFVIEGVLPGLFKIADWVCGKRHFIALERAACAPLFVRLLGLRQYRACVRISKPCTGYVRQDAGHNCGGELLGFLPCFIFR